jgi:V/A-type H+-transporting ATPase subunit A
MTQNSLRVTGAFWALDTGLAHQRHFPAISWTKSYTLFLGQVRGWYEKNVATDWSVVRERLLAILQKEIELQEIVQLVGPDALPESEKGTLEVARSVRQDFLQQFAFDPIDAFCPIDKQMDIARVILAYDDAIDKALARGVLLSQILDLDIRARIAAIKTTENKQAKTDAKQLLSEIPLQLDQLEVV